MLSKISAMHPFTVSLLAAVVVPSSCGLVPRQLNASTTASPSYNANGTGGTTWQPVPSVQPKPDNMFNTLGAWRQGLPANSAEIGPEIYDARSIDIPFRRLQQGNLIYFKEGELNSPSSITDEWAPGHNDFANQSACGIPDNAFFNSKVAIHPYWLKYAPDGLGLDRKRSLFLTCLDCDVCLSRPRHYVMQSDPSCTSSIDDLDSC